MINAKRAWAAVPGSFAFPDGNVGEVSCPDLYIVIERRVMSEVSDISK